MKKIKFMIGILLILSILAVTGCANDDQDDMNDVSDSEETTDATAGSEETPLDPEAFMPSEINYGAGLDENGYLDNITALDFIVLPDYMNIPVPFDVHTISDVALQAEIDNLLTYYETPNQITDRAAVDGDTVNIDYVGSIDGVEFEGGNTGGSGTDVTIGVTSYIDDFLEQIIGHTPGESFDVLVTFPEDYGKEDLNGKDAVFATTLNYISETTTPELNDQFVLDNLTADYKWTSVDEMKAAIMSDLQTTSMIGFLQTYLLTNVEVTSLPEAATLYQNNVMINYYKSAANSYGMSIEDYLSGSGGPETIEALVASYADQLAEATKMSLIVQGIAEDAKIVVTDADISAYFLENFGSEDYSVFEEQYGLPYIKSTLLQESVFDYLIDNAKLES